MSEFSARIRDRDGVPVIVVSGDLDGRAGDALEDAFSTATRTGTQALVLNFEELGFMNSTGIALVVGLLGRARQHGIEVHACGLDDHYRHVFEITRLADFMAVCADEEEATGRSRRAEAGQRADQTTGRST